MSTSESLQLAIPSKLTIKQQKLLDELDLAISKTGIKLCIDNPIGTAFLEGPIALDVEHDEQGNLVGIGVCNGIQCDYWTKVFPDLVQYLVSQQIIAHNGVSDFECLKIWGINVRDEQLIHDTMLIGHILDSSLKSYSLKDMAKRELDINYCSYDDIVGKRGLKAERTTLDKQPMELVAAYNSLDCWATFALYQKQRKQLGLA